MRTLRILLCVPALALWMTSAAQRQVEDANDEWLFSYKEATAKPCLLYTSDAADEL